MYDTPPISPTQVRCVACGYDLSGTVIGGLCPECGVAVDQTLKRPVTAKTSSAAITGLVCSILGWVLCGPIAIVTIFTHVQVKSQYEQGLCDRSSVTMSTVAFWLAIAILILNAVGLAFLVVLMGIGGF